MLEIQNAIVHYGEAIAVQKASVKVEAGELVCLLGPNGAGKTTLLNTICGLIRPTAGAINFLGKDINNLSAAAIQRMGISQVPAVTAAIINTTPTNQVAACCARAA